MAVLLSDMFARLNQINVEISDVERLISSKNQTIILALEKGTDTLDEENEIIVLNKALQLKRNARRKVMAELGIFGGGGLCLTYTSWASFCLESLPALCWQGDMADLASPEHKPRHFARKLRS